jgi:hypothetical protein
MPHSEVDVLTQNWCECLEERKYTGHCHYHMLGPLYLATKFKSNTDNFDKDKHMTYNEVLVI